MTTKGEAHGGTYQELLDWLSRPPSDYGNHSCEHCAVSGDCPVRNFIEDTASPNSCSFYWPPNADKAPGEWYWEQLEKVKEETINARAKVALERDGMIAIETGKN